jgi:hypothetical protein
MSTIGHRSAIKGPFLLLSGAMISNATACTGPQGTDIEAERAAVAAAIDGTIAWAKTKDLDWLYGIIANDSTYLEVHPEDVVVKGFEEFTRMEEFWASPFFRASGHEIRDLQITFSRSGDVAWFYCMLDDVNEWRGQPVSWINTRWTGVLEKRDGNWVMVQMHFSNAMAQ